MTEWRVKVGGNVEPDLIDVEVVTNANPFGDHATAYIADADGEREKEYPPRQRVDFEAREFGSGNAWTTVLEGFVVEARGRTEDGADTLEVECHSLDALLRKGEMNGDLEGANISGALEIIIKNWVQGVAWNANNVDVQNESILQRSFTNEKVDNVIRSLRDLSAGEAFGVTTKNGTIEFEFGPAETKTVDRGIGPGDWVSYETPEKSKESINEVRVFYDEGDRSVIVDDSGNKRDLQATLGAPEPVTAAESIMREDITDRQAAIAAGERVLGDRSTAQEVTVTTFGLIDAEPRDTISVTIPQADINDEYVIAQIQYGLPDQAEVKMVPADVVSQKSRNATTDMLVRVSDSLKRVEMRPAAADDEIEETVRAIETLTGAVINVVDGGVDNTAIDEFVITNAGFRALRDAIINQSALTISDVVVGDGSSSPSRSQTSLDNQVDSRSATSVISGHDKVTFDVGSNYGTSLTVTEFGLELSTGDLFLRATLVDGVDAPSTAGCTLAVGNDPDIDRAIVTETGQSMIRDAIASTMPTWPDQFALGSGSPTYSDETLTSLDNQVVSRALGNNIVRAESTTDGLDRFTNISSGDPISVVNGSIRHDQVAYVLDAQDDTLHDNQTSGSQFTGGQAVNFDSRDSGDIVQIQFDADRDIPAAHAKVAVRGIANPGSRPVDIYVRGQRDDALIISPSLDWDSTSIGTDIVGGEINTVLIDGNQSGGGANNTDIDVLVVYDERHVSGDPSTWDNSISANGYLTDPKLYADATDLSLGIGPDVSLDRQVTQSTCTISINDTSNNQAISIQGATGNNTNTVTVSHGSTSTLNIVLTLSRFGSTRNATPEVGYKAQTIDSVQIDTAVGSGGSIGGTQTVEFESYIAPGTISQGTGITEAGLLDSSGDLMSLSDLAFTAESDVTYAIRETLRLRRATLPSNQPDFDVGLVSLTSSSASGTDYRVSITGTSTSI